MKALQQRTAEQGLVVHAAIPPRVYADDGVQKERIERTRAFLAAAIPLGTSRIIELGCGTCDISGPFANDQLVCGFDCNEEALKVAWLRYPHIARLDPYIPDEPQEADVLVCCEFLEHIPNPSELIARWLPKAERCVISHPLDGDLTGDLSAGEHQWSFSMEDFQGWFTIGGHKLIAWEVIPMGGYRIVVGRGERIGESA